MNYKGYIGHVEFDEDNAIFVGEIINTKDIITFQSDTAHGLKQEFIDSIEDYLDFCKARNEAPEKPFRVNSILEFLLSYIVKFI